MDNTYEEEKEAVKQKMNTLLEKMKDGTARDNIEEFDVDIENRMNEEAVIHKLKILLIGFMRDIASDFEKEDKNKDIMIPFKDVCQVCYLFFWGLYPLLYILNGSGEDGDEPFCNGIMLVDINDGRCNFLNIYNAVNPKQLITLNENWDKQECGACVVERLLLPEILLNKYDQHKLFDPNLRYRCIFRCGGKYLREYDNGSYEFSVIIYKDDYKLLETIHETIVEEASVRRIIIRDSLPAYQVLLPDITECLFQIDSELIARAMNNQTNITECKCVWSETYGLITTFVGNNIFHFDWYNTFEWKRISTIPNIQIFNLIDNWFVSTICIVEDKQNGESLFLTTRHHNKDHDPHADDDEKQIYTNTALYSFANQQWKPLRLRKNYNAIFDVCYDLNRNRVYALFQRRVICYDMNNDKWIYDLFPSFSEPNVKGALFLDKLFGDRLFFCADATQYIDLLNPTEWIESEHMQFQNTLHYESDCSDDDYPLHGVTEFERLLCAR